MILVVLIIFMMIQISRLQGTARVINYAGLVRGATQREVKLEIAGNQNDELIKYLEDVYKRQEYKYINYDLEVIRQEYDRISNTIMEMQIALDRYNQTMLFDVDI